MLELNTACAVKDRIGPKAVTSIRQPESCPVQECSAIVLYEQELQRHTATVAGLREKVLNEISLLRQKDELLLQKDILAKEAEHRLLNGLQLIKSLLAIQSRSTENLEAAAQLNMAALRLSTLSRIHQHLHAMDAFESVDFKPYLARLCRDLSDFVPKESSESALDVEGDEMTIPRVIATPLAFIASEIITNSIKYAKGRIIVTLQKLPNGVASLSVSDDGPGLPDAFDPASTKGLGMQIIGALARQIDGKIEFGKGENGSGARCSVTFRSQA